MGYARDVLGAALWGPVAEALRSLLVPPYRVSVDSGHGIGKTYGAAVAVNWWYDTRDPSWTITTAPTERDVIDLLWTEVRLQRQRARVALPQDLQPSAPEMRSGPEHAAKGYTARDANSAQGRHRPNMLFVFDEKEGVPGPFWDGVKSMFRPGSGDAVLAIGNPLSTNSRAYQEHRATDADGNPTWHRRRVSSLDHPNIAAGLAGEPLPVPGAVTCGQVDQWVQDWCDPVAQGDEKPTDICWRGRHYRPGPIGEPRILGLRPSAGTFGVWGEALFQATLGPEPEIPFDALPEIGCDVANYGTDYTVFHVRWGPVSLLHQSVNGWGADRILDRLKELARWCAELATARRDRQAAPVPPSAVPVKVDDDATGRAIFPFLVRAGFRAVPVNAASTPRRPDLYSNVRSELWFYAARKAGAGLLNLSRLGRAERQRLELQALAPVWWPNEAGQRVVESKDDLRDPKRLGRSPDDADGMNLAYYEPAGDGVPRPVATERSPGRESAAKRRGLWGMQ